MPDVVLERRRKTSPLGSCSCSSTTVPGSSGGHRAGPFPSPTSTVHGERECQGEHGERECQGEDAHPRVGWRVPEAGQLPFLLWGLRLCLSPTSSGTESLPQICILFFPTQLRKTQKRCLVITVHQKCKMGWGGR